MSELQTESYGINLWSVIFTVAGREHVTIARGYTKAEAIESVKRDYPDAVIVKIWFECEGDAPKPKELPAARRAAICRELLAKIRELEEVLE